MKEIPFDQKVEGKRQAVFSILFALDNQPWQNYPEVSPEKKDVVVPTCLMINRADGWIGFVGGAAEEGESLETAVKREVKEEVGYEIVVGLEPLVAHDIGSKTTHAFALQLPFAQLKKIQLNMDEASHSSEITGVFLPHLVDYRSLSKGGIGVGELIRSSLAPSVREELIQFLLKKNIFPKTQLVEICQEVGFSLEELLK